MFNNRTCFQNHTLQQWSPTSRVFTVDPSKALDSLAEVWGTSTCRARYTHTHTHIHIYIYIYIYISTAILYNNTIYAVMSFKVNIKLKSLCLTFIWAQSHRTEWRHRVLLKAADWCALSVTVYKVLSFISSLYDVNMMLDVEFPCLYGRVLQDTWSFTSLYWFSLM